MDPNGGGGLQSLSGRTIIQKSGGRKLSEGLTMSIESLTYADLVDPITLNQRVQGSSPCAPTNKVNVLATTDLGLKKVVSALCPH